MTSTAQQAALIGKIAEKELGDLYTDFLEYAYTVFCDGKVTGRQLDHLKQKKIALKRVLIQK